MSMNAKLRPVWLKKNEDRRIRAGHLWVFSNEVDAERSPLSAFEPGEAATLRDHSGKCLGSVCVNPSSLIFARLHSRRPDQDLDEELLENRLRQALKLRESLFSAPWYRLCHAEGDFLPGLVIDRYGNGLVLQLGTAALEARRDALLRCLQRLLDPGFMFFENRIYSRRLEGLAQEPASVGPDPGLVDIPENGCVFKAPLAQGQKTGWYYDQRENRALFSRWARGRRVLDICCYAGGFGVGAAAGGAASVTFMDSSAQALELAAGNMAANAPGSQASYLRGDAFQLLEDLAASQDRFDLVSLDPPAFIKRRRDMATGLAAYRKINALALSLLAPGGILASSSCSQHLEERALFDSVARAAVKQKKRLRVLHRGWQAPDHPMNVAMPETAYLKCLMVQAG